MKTERISAPRKIKAFGDAGAAVRLALTGTPGTGKSAVGRALARKGVHVVSVSDAARRLGAVTGIDARRRSAEVDVRRLGRALARELASSEGDVVLEGHLSHHLPVDSAFVLRCPPAVLARRLRRRRWPEAKVRENVCAEALGVIVTEAVESLGRRSVFEFSTSGVAAGRSAALVRRVLAGQAKGLRAGNIDYLEEAPRWC
jgi:adenylate kinase